MKANGSEDHVPSWYFFGAEMETLRAYFDRHAPSWDEMLKYNERITELLEVVSWFGLEEGHWVLDVGTGTGILLPLIQQAIGPKGMLVGFDFSLKMIEMAKLREFLGKKMLFTADANSIPIQSNLFDRVICFSAFPHFSNKLNALKEMTRVLKRGGLLFIAHLKSVEELNQFHKNLGEPVSKDLLPSPQTLKNMMKDVGFIEVNIINQPGKFLAHGQKI